MTQAKPIRKSALIIFAIITFIAMIHALPAKAQNIIRDSEIESYMAEWFAPIFKANNMSPEQVKIILVQDDSVNAFVAGGANIFFYTGLIEKTDNPGELIGVMAHELGHISGGHLVRGREALEQASYENILGTILSIGAAVASGDSSAVVAGSAASNSVAQRRFLSKTRTFESSADQAAIQSMKRAEMNPEGLLSFMKKLEGQELLPASQQSEYVRSHPLTHNRIQSIKAKVQESNLTSKSFPDEWIEQHARMKAKLIGYIHPEQVDWVFDVSDQSIPARYARAVSLYRQNKIDNALSEIDALLDLEPRNPYFYELKGQMLVDFGRVEQGIDPLKQALKFRPQDGLLRTALAHAQIETANSEPLKLNYAIKNLKIAQRAEPRSTRVHRLLATAYGRQNKPDYAKLHLAEEALLQNKKSYAKQQAKTALQTLPPESAAAIRAKDIILFTSKNKRSQKN
jgi:predicted Zn-dependent protease